MEGMVGFIFLFAVPQDLHSPDQMQSWFEDEDGFDINTCYWSSLWTQSWAQVCNCVTTIVVA